MKDTPTANKTSSPQLDEALREVSRLRQKVKILERDNKLLAMSNANADKLHKFHVKRKKFTIPL